MNTASTNPAVGAIGTGYKERSWLASLGGTLLFILVFCVGLAVVFLLDSGKTAAQWYRDLRRQSEEFTPGQKLTIILCIFFCLFVLTLTFLSMRWW